MVMVEVFHFPRGPLDEILAEGLKSAEQLKKEGKIKFYPPDYATDFYGLEDHAKNIYFQWLTQDRKEGVETDTWVSIEVDAETTPVFNIRYRFMGLEKDYQCSQMSLAHFIAHYEKFMQMREETTLKPGQTLILHGITAEHVIDDEIPPTLQGYYNEIIIARTVIPQSEFKIYHRGKEQEIEQFRRGWI